MMRGGFVTGARLAVVGSTVIVAAALSGCSGPHEYTIVVKDPRRVQLAGVDVPTPARPADGAPTIAAQPNHDPPWALVVFREDDGGLRLRCAACGRDAYLVAGDGVMHVLSDQEPDALGLVRPTSNDANADASADALVQLPYSYCGFPAKHGCRAAAWDGVRVTPWSNVIEVRKRNAARALGSPVMLVAAGIAGGVGTAFVIDGATSDHPAVGALGIAAGTGMLVLGAAIVKAFIDGNIERRIDPPSP